MALTFDVNIKNNIATKIPNASPYGNFYFGKDVGDTGTTTSSNNLSSDASADDLGGSGHIINEPANNIFENPVSDWNLRPTSMAIDAGATVGTFDWDALHITGDSWRPQGSAWDIGALEKFITKLTIKGSTTIKGATTLR